MQANLHFDPTLTFAEQSTKSSSQTLPKKIKEEEIPRFKGKQIEAMNFQSDLQAIFIAILSKYTTISIGRPHRMSHMTKQFLKIKEIEFNRFDSINVLQFIQTRSKEQAQHEFATGNTSKKTAKRRIQPTKRREVMRLLQDFISELGFLVVVENETVEGYEGKVTIYQNGSLLFNTQQIRDFGNQINQHLASSIQTATSITVTKDSFIF
ncbi:hypothetical protein EIN_227520 [Entamoeba invadens IP1]|uniref:Uncharacterized protein n=1 Tax=Entamoeba invadens IP1 TaxID=370355 RepID=A0A0A1U2T5_ENTIV|nr:hypothetical protein EIN_227520 [Entamoeba invadens IP1]ELP88339.1 hypothetical protein EIN_227520 [Entamoeba invadens IP1]|eukprot:XP_004255110.1 hypothetical protein EIN_227520 [Entamoeba invadens IP1]